MSDIHELDVCDLTIECAAQRNLRDSALSEERRFSLDIPLDPVETDCSYNTSYIHGIGSRKDL